MCCLHVLSSIVILNYSSVVMSLQSLATTYFLHLHSGTGADVGVGDNPGVENTNGGPQWGHSNSFRHGGGGESVRPSDYKKEREF